MYTKDGSASVRRISIISDPIHRLPQVDAIVPFLHIIILALFSIHRLALRKALIAIPAILVMGLIASLLFYKWIEWLVAKPILLHTTDGCRDARVCDGYPARGKKDPLHDAPCLSGCSDACQNAAAYEEEQSRLKHDIRNGRAELALVVVDVNGLKQINDTYGHSRGDEFIIGTIRIVCDVYRHSSVFRIGGDEFLVLLEGRDFLRRDELLSEIVSVYADTSGRSDLDPWRRYDAAIGMSEYRSGDVISDVFDRADSEMYRNKAEKKESIM